MKRYAFVLAATLLTGCLSSTAGDQISGDRTKAGPKGLRLYAMDCGRIAFSDADRFADDGAYAGTARTLMVPCYLIRHPEGDLLWNTGVPQALADLPGGRAMNGATVTVPHRLTDQLKQIGVTPASIEYLAMSHSHVDHIGNAALFAGSTWIVDPEERAYAFRPQARADKQSFAIYAALEGSKIRAFDRSKPLDVFGDKSVTIVSAPGHTPGHMILLIRLPKSGPVLLSGDMWHVAESRAARRVPRFNTDRAQTLSSMDLVEKIAADTQARVVREHVPEDFTSLPEFPAALE